MRPALLLVSLWLIGCEQKPQQPGNQPADAPPAQQVQQTAQQVAPQTAAPAPAPTQPPSFDPHNPSRTLEWLVAELGKSWDVPPGNQIAAKAAQERFERTLGGLAGKEIAWEVPLDSVSQKEFKFQPAASLRVPAGRVNRRTGPDEADPYFFLQVAWVLPPKPKQPRQPNAQPGGFSMNLDPDALKPLLPGQHRGVSTEFPVGKVEDWMARLKKGDRLRVRGRIKNVVQDSMGVMDGRTHYLQTTFQVQLEAPRVEPPGGK